GLGHLKLDEPQRWMANVALPRLEIVDHDHVVGFGAAGKRQAAVTRPGEVEDFLGLEMGNLLWRARPSADGLVPKIAHAFACINKRQCAAVRSPVGSSRVG